MRGWATVLAVAVLAAAGAGAGAQQVTGMPAADFRLIDADGRPVTLSQFRGRTVVLEWNNPGCPFVQKHYKSGNMQRTQAAARAGGAVWLTINSAAPGKQGFMEGAAAKAFVAGQKAQPTAYLLDPTGAAGRRYLAKTTPQMFVIDGAGRLRYHGAIDSKPTADPADIATARNHVAAALAELKAGRPVSLPETRPYGCSVKYAG